MRARAVHLKGDEHECQYGEEFQRVGKDGFDATVRAFGEANKGFQAIAAEVTDYSKKSSEGGTRAFERAHQC